MSGTFPSTVRRLQQRQRVVGAVAIAAALVTAIALVGGGGTSKVSTHRAVTNPITDDRADAGSGPFVRGHSVGDLLGGNV